MAHVNTFHRWDGCLVAKKDVLIPWWLDGVTYRESGVKGKAVYVFFNSSPQE